MRVEELRSAVLAWYRPRRRAYAWRRGRRDPYGTLVSEVMLQQTQANRVEPVYQAFLQRFPDLAALAAAPRDAVIRAWVGLGYNRRAVALHEAARAIARDHGGRVPADPEELRRLPGVGPYTAAAVASIGWGIPVPAVDTNVRRICARVVHGVEPEEVPAASLEEDARAWVDPSTPGDWNQALMDLGRLVCRPAPRCAGCPLARTCRFRAAGGAGRPSPRRAAPFEGSARQVRGAVVRVLRDLPFADENELADATGHGVGRIRAAATDLVRDGVVERMGAGALRLATR